MSIGDRLLVSLEFVLKVSSITDGVDAADDDVLGVV